MEIQGNFSVPRFPVSITHANPVHGYQSTALSTDLETLNVRSPQSDDVWYFELG